MRGVWKSLTPPIRILAPMEDVTDHVFRNLIARLGGPDLYFTEFILADVVANLSAEQLAHRRPGRPAEPAADGAGERHRGAEIDPGDGGSPRASGAADRAADGVAARPGGDGGSPRTRRRDRVPGRLRWGEADTPLIAQIWGTRPESYFKAAQNLSALGFDGVDINMGCPAHKIRKHGACSGLIANPSLAGELIAAAREGAGQLPVSVKTRIGLDRPVTEQWCGFLLDQGIDALTVHGRTAEEMSEGVCRWEEIRKVVAMRDAGGYETVIVGNGDLRTPEEMTLRWEQTGVEGLMVGRGVFEDPYIFSGGGELQRFRSRSKNEKLLLLLGHLRAFRSSWEGERNYEIMKKFYKIYLVGFEESEEIRNLLNETHDFESAEEILHEYGV